ncbi:hypothetical protein [Lacrimispora saccharolytica]|uniref:hypothetical protein n=1 Tax=Lacrimispora saccharolytica TaxID=84030 RepID=UPI000318EAC1|nr:hypothetical protein [Lacrimispora saccharolytica]QRV18946.1 hypothetical protein I6K70_15830 [Lacrimispora saccharolytica]
MNSPAIVSRSPNYHPARRYSGINEGNPRLIALIPVLGNGSHFWARLIGIDGANNQKLKGLDKRV